VNVLGRFQCKGEGGGICSYRQLGTRVDTTLLLEMSLYSLAVNCHWARAHCHHIALGLPAVERQSEYFDAADWHCQPFGVQEQTTVSKSERRKFEMKRFYVKKLGVMEFNEQRNVSQGTAFFYGGGAFSPAQPPPPPKLEDYPLSAVPDCLFNIFAATLHIWRPSLLSATR
jgi:hypothetical protein